MFLKITSYIRAFLRVDVSERKHKEFVESINKINVARGKLTSLMFIVLESMLLVIAFLVRKGDSLKARGLYYTLMYLLMLLVMLIFYLIFSRLEKNISQNRNQIRVFGTLFTSFILCWCAGVSLLDQMSSGQIMVYVFAVLSVAVTPYFDPLALLLIYLPIQTAFAVLLITVTQSSGIPSDNLLNSTTFIMIAWVISSMRYRQRATEFNNAKIIEDKNLELKEVNQQLEKLSQLDGLTGINNRLMFDLAIKSEWDRCKRQFLPLSLLMIDIDFFKGYNDHYGHQAGDECIRQIAGALSACTKRATDTVARYGGEEFAAILPYTERKDAGMIAEQMREEVEGLRIPYVYSDISEYVTISLGVYTITPAGVMSVEEFIENADKALYDAKKCRNKVVMSS